MGFPRLLNPFATTRFTLRTHLTVGECAARMDGQTLGWFQLKGLFDHGSTPLSGSVGDSGFRVRRRTRFPRNTYQPLTAGSWREHDGQTEISVKLFEDPAVAWLSVLWLAVAVVVATMFVASAASGAISSSLTAVSVPAMLLLPSLGLTAQMYARWMARYEPDIMRAFLANLLEARDERPVPEQIPVSEPAAA
jgi:hypothetical protein